MKERLDRENIEALAAYRFQRAEETLKEIRRSTVFIMPAIMPQSLCSSSMS
mgnify:CR=1 FL=1